MSFIPTGPDRDWYEVNALEIARHCLARGRYEVAAEYHRLGTRWYEDHVVNQPDPLDDEHDHDHFREVLARYKSYTGEFALLTATRGKVLAYLAAHPDGSDRDAVDRIVAHTGVTKMGVIYNQLERGGWIQQVKRGRKSLLFPPRRPPISDRRFCDAELPRPDRSGAGNLGTMEVTFVGTSSRSGVLARVWSLVPRIFGCLVLALGGFAVMVVVVAVSASRKPSRPEVAPRIGPETIPLVQSRPAPFVPPAGPPPAAPSAPLTAPSVPLTAPAAHAAFPPGAEVEVVTHLLCDILATYRERNAPGGPSRRFVLGQEIFGVSSSEHAVVQLQDGDAVQVRLVSGNWSGRTGWLAVTGVRRVPTAEDLAGDVKDGLALGARRRIYAEHHLAGIAATEAADQRYPLGASVTAESLKAREVLYQARLKQGLDVVLRRHRLDRARLGAIEKEGDGAAWPLRVAGPSPPDEANAGADAPARKQAVPSRAERDLNIARNLEQSEKIDAALSAYRQVVKDHAGSTEAGTAARRIEALLLRRLRSQ